MSYTKNYNILYNHLFFNNIFNPINYFLFLEDISIEHCEKLGIGLDYLYPNNYAWFIRKWNAKFFDYPKFMDIISINTIPYALYNYFGYRKYSVFRDDKCLAEIDSEWIFINTQTSKLQTLPDLFYEKFNAKNEKYNFFNLAPFANINTSKTYNLLSSDFDTNNHLNNISYLRYFIGSIGIDILSRFHMKEIKIIYKSQADISKPIEVQLENKFYNKNIFINSNILSGNNLCCLIESIWKEI